MKAWSTILNLDFLLKRLLAHFMTPVFLLIAFMAHSDATHCSETFRALVKGSTVARGTIDSATSASSRTGRRTWGVEYTFTGWNGRTYKGSQRNLSNKDWKVGADTAVYYDGADPSHNALDVGQLRLTGEFRQPGRAALSGVRIVDRHLPIRCLLAPLRAVGA